MARIRRRFRFEGRVQGVGFRYTAARLAAGYAVVGYVRNLPDGAVELVAEGEPNEVAALIAAIRGEFAPMIRSVDATDEPLADPLPDGFHIRH